jgi:2-octaprenyl-6-methoxyphenol hydroxylase
MSKRSLAAEMVDYDVLIAGAGPVGSALALALRGVSSVALLEARSEGSSLSAARPIALSHGSRLILERLGAWEALQPATPIARIHISQRGGFGQAELDCEEARLPALGYVVDYNRLTQVLSQLAAGACDYFGGASVLTLGAGPDAGRVSYQVGTTSKQMSARLVALADGGTVARVTQVRTRDYRQAALTAEITCARPHRNVAYERFTAEGPLALLPFGARLALVWSISSSSARELCSMPEHEFLQHLQRAFGQRLGAFEAAGPRVSHPLALKVTGTLQLSRAVVLGNAAQTLHPVAGQGFNLGLRDAWELADVIRGVALEEIGGAAMLAAYAARRRLDRGGGIWFTDTLVRLFSNDFGPLRLARGLGLALLGAVPPAKDFVVRRMTFGARG